MIPRHQLPVWSPVDGRSLWDGVRGALRGTRDLDAIRERLSASHAGGGIALLDSGTSALVAALRLTTPRGGTVLLPAYGCVDISAAVERARLRARLYDLDPATLTPDLESVRRGLAAGVDAIVVAHLYGYPADVGAVRELARTRGVPVIEDAAQRAGGVLRGCRSGEGGDLVVLSFGRGKGTTGGGGGALLAFAEPWRAQVRELEEGLRARGRGWRALGVLAALWALGRPEVYALPSAIPWLRLGEMVYHPAREPGSLSPASAGVLRRSLAMDGEELARRRETAARLLGFAEGAPDVVPVRALPDASPGYLRLAVRSASRTPDRRLGIARGYPTTLEEHPPLAPRLVGRGDESKGAGELARTLLTLPTHGLMRPRDIVALKGWLIGER